MLSAGNTLCQTTLTLCCNICLTSKCIAKKSRRNRIGTLGTTATTLQIRLRKVQDLVGSKKLLNRLHVFIYHETAVNDEDILVNQQLGDA